MATLDSSLPRVQFTAETDAGYGDVLSAHLPTVKAVVNALARKHRLNSDAQQDLGSVPSSGGNRRTPFVS